MDDLMIIELYFARDELGILVASDYHRRRVLP